MSVGKSQETQLYEGNQVRPIYALYSNGIPCTHCSHCGHYRDCDADIACFSAFQAKSLALERYMLYQIF